MILVEWVFTQSVFLRSGLWVRNAAVDGDVEHGSLMAGQSVGILNKVQPLRAILQDIVDEADQGLGQVMELMRDI